jgi:hypothetical protein
LSISEPEGKGIFSEKRENLNEVVGPEGIFEISENCPKKGYQIA